MLLVFNVENTVVHCWTEIVFQASTDAGNTSFIPDSFVEKAQTQHTERWGGEISAWGQHKMTFCVLLFCFCFALFLKHQTGSHPQKYRHFLESVFWRLTEIQM